MTCTRSITYGRIALWGCFDPCDPADAMLATALLRELRQRQPGARLVAFSEDPNAIRERHGIEARTPPARRRPRFGRRRAQTLAGFDVLVVASPDPSGADREGVLARLEELCTYSGTRLDLLSAPDPLFATELSRHRQETSSTRPAVGVNPRADSLPRVVDFVAWLLLERYPVRLLSSCSAERELCLELEARLRDEGVLGRERGLGTEAPLLESLRDCDLVVSSRYHCMLLAALLHIPTLGLCEGEASRALLESLGQARHALDVTGLALPRLVDEFCLLRATATAARERLAARVPECRRDLQTRYDHLYGPVVSA